MIRTINVTNPPRRKIVIGHYGENQFRQVIFDVTDWKEQFPNGTPMIVFKRGDGDTYPIVPSVNSDGNPVFIPTSTETSVVGDCYFQLRWTIGDVVGKSCDFVGYVESALGDYGETPEYHSDWIDQIVERTSEIVDAATQAKNDAQAAAATATSAANRAEQSSQAATQSLGDLSNLTTNEKSNIIGAINEVNSKASTAQSAAATIGNLSSLTTDEKGSIVGAINEVDAHADAAQAAANQAAADASTANSKTGDLTTLRTAQKANLVAAINELNAKFGMDLVVDANDGKLYITQNSTRVGNGVEITVDGGGLAFDGGYIAKIDATGGVSQDYYLHFTKGGAELPRTDFTPFVVPAQEGGGFAVDSWGTTEENDTVYLHLYDAGGHDLLTPVALPAGSGGGGTGSTLRLLNRTGSSSLSVGGGTTPVNLIYNWTSVDADNNSTGNGSATWTVNGTKVAVQGSVTQGDQTFNVRQYLTDGMENVIKLTIEDATTATRSITWRVTSLIYGLSWRLEDFSVVGTGSLNVSMVPTGLGEKTVHVAVDGTEIFSKSVMTSGSTVSATVAQQSHGAHRIEGWVSAVVDGQTITTEPLVSIGLWVEQDNMTPFVAMTVDDDTVSRFALATVKFIAYNPAAETASVRLTENGTVVNTLTVDRSVQTWQYRARTAGTITLGANIGGYGSTITLTVSDVSSNIGEVTEGLAIKLDPTGHNNNEANRLSFGYTDANGTNHPLNLSNGTVNGWKAFDWVSGGFQTDDDGTAFVVKRGTYADFDTSFFRTFQPAQGKEIKIMFKSKNVRNYDAALISDHPANGEPGIQVNAQNATLYSTRSSVTVPYIEDKLIEMDINIESSGENMIAAVWLKGVPSRFMTFDAETVWAQGSQSNKVRIGSQDADVWIYLIRMYSSSLTRSDILKNWVADCSDVDEMTDRNTRNDIFSADAETVDPNRLAVAAPNLRQIRITANKMTTGKDDKVTCTVQHVFPAGASSSGNRHNWSATNVTMKAQGTSSLDYLASAPNIDLDFKKAKNWETEDGVALTGYAMTDNSIPVNYFNIKANVASSENANNVCLADDYNTYNPYVCAPKQADPRVRDTVEGHPCVIFFTNPADNPSDVMLGSRACPPGKTIMFFVGDMNNSKKNLEVFGQDNTRYPKQCCVEFLNNNTDPVRFLGAPQAIETYTGKAIKKQDDHDDDFEFRYPEDFTQEQLSAFTRMHAWVRSTDTTKATGAQLGTYAIYGGQQYTTDSAAYRRAKFIYEFEDYFVKDQMLFHYLFTERHCMVDNRAKNVFFCYEYIEDLDDYRWSVRCDYDNDTAEGNDNSGGLTFTYGLEDIDQIGVSDVFNASKSVLWCNIRDFMKNDLATMYNNREGAGAWNSDRILRKFIEYQHARPEALDVEDMWYKYVAPYTNPNVRDGQFIRMMLGRKEDQREQFEKYQEMYCASKYGSDLWRNDFIGLRGNDPQEWSGVEPDVVLTITPYADMYLRVDYGNAATSAHVRAKRGVPTVLPVTAQFNPTDLEIQIRGASMISDIDGLPALYSKKLAISRCKKLTRLVFGSREPGYSNTSVGTDAGGISLGDSPLLEIVDLSGLPNLKDGVNLSGLTFLKEFYAAGSGISSVSFAENSPVEVAVLPAVNSLTARGLTSLTTFTMSGTNLTSIWVERSPLINTYDLVSASNTITRLRLVGVDWNAPNADAVVPLAYVSGYDATGNPSNTPVLTGQAYFSIITNPELTAITDAFPAPTENTDGLEVSYGQIVQSYTVTFQDLDGTILYTQPVRSGGNAADPVAAGHISAPTKEGTDAEKPYYSYAFSGWSASLDNITANLTVTPVFSRQDKYYNVYWYNGTSLLQRANVKAGSKAVYTAGDVTPPTGKIWGGFDQLTTKVLSDIITYAVFYEPTLPKSFPTVTSDMFLYSDDPADTSAYTFEEFWYLCSTLDSNGTPLCRQYFNVGDRIKIIPNTTAFTDESIILQVEDTWDHYRTSDRSKWTNVFFGMVGVMNANRGMRASSTNVGGYDGKTTTSEVTMASWLDGTMLSNLPPHWRGIMEEMSVPYSAGGGSSEILYGNHKVTLRSQTEVFGDTGTPYGAEMEPGATYRTLRVYTSTNSRIKRMYNNTASSGSHWWLRSPAAGSSTSYCYVRSGGNSDPIGASNSNGVSWGFCVGSHES